MRHHLSPVDAAWLHMESPTEPMTVCAVLSFAQPVRWEAIVQRVQERVLDVFPRFRQRIVEPALGIVGAFWEDDPTFALAAHLHRFALPPPGGPRELQAFVGDRIGTPLDLARPAWSMDLVDGYGEGAAIVFRGHHCVADGMALGRVLLELVDEPPAAPRPHTDAPSGEPWLHRLAHEGPDALHALEKLLLTPHDAPTRLKGPLGVLKRAAWSAPIPMDVVRARGRALGASVNDLLCAAVSGAIRRYLVDRGDPAVDVRAFVPVDLRGGDGASIDPSLGNRFGLVYLSLPVATPDPGVRVAEVKRRMDAIKATPEAGLAFGLIGALGLLPAGVERRLADVFGAKCTIVLTNVRGPSAPVSIAGHPVSGMMFWVPQSGHLGVGVSLYSYANAIHIGVVTDVGLVPDPEALVAGIEAELGVAP